MDAVTHTTTRSLPPRADASALLVCVDLPTWLPSAPCLDHRHRCPRDTSRLPRYDRYWQAAMDGSKRGGGEREKGACMKVSHLSTLSRAEEDYWVAAYKALLKSAMSAGSRHEHTHTKGLTPREIPNGGQTPQQRRCICTQTHQAVMCCCKWQTSTLWQGCTFGICITHAYSWGVCKTGNIHQEADSQAAVGGWGGSTSCSTQSQHDGTNITVNITLHEHT